VKRARNFLAYGFGISIAVHMGVLPFVHPERTVAKEEPPPDVLYRMKVPTPPPTPHPTPTPEPTPQPTPPPRENRQTPAPQQRHVLIHAPPQTVHHGGVSEPGNIHTRGDVNGTPDGAQSAAPAALSAPATPAAPEPTPTPRPTPTPLSCARPQVPATTVRALEPETPPLAQQQGITGTVNVVVSLDALSRVVAARIQSSPSAVLNGAALAAARGSQYRTEVKNCEPVAADYIFSVDFTAQ
jgi:outer membrane biosynthesis protein TonB